MKAGRSNQEAPRLPLGLAKDDGSIGEWVFGVKLAALDSQGDRVNALVTAG